MEEITAEYASQTLIAPPELKVRTKVSIGAKTDLGRVRENNEDKFEYYIPEDDGMLALRGMAFVVCDGMGGHAAGQIASELSTKTFLDVYFNHPGDSTPSALLSGIKAANRYVLDVANAVPSRRGMGTTLSALIFLQDQAWVAHVGDSRIYRLRGNELAQITHDHTWVDEAIRMGQITPEEGETHKYRHVLTRAIGTEDAVAPDIFSFDLAEGDRFLLCSDGLINHVDDPEIAETLASFGPSEAAWKLVNSALVGGGSDNCTVMVVRVDAISPA
ncbi:MAG TPA: Stp1/IreP family PP2C-type Ser/Thr phosphatase [Fimbriimonadaceae bacterium]|nr:Stp1/IreP family PP2C-type Ser/Thr phosphatase [Fimbriimonadaceae bacterium]